MADSVKVTKSHTLVCEDRAQLDGIEEPWHLSPIDMLVPPIITVAVVFVYEKQGDKAVVQLDRLKKALQVLLNYYPHLTGRLDADDKSGMPHIVKLGSGGELLEAECSVRIDELRSQSQCGRLTMQDLPDKGNALLPPFLTDPNDIASKPFFTVQHTRFACGGVAVGIKIPHTVCDGEGFFQLVYNLVELYNKLGEQSDPALESPPSIRSVLAGPNALTEQERKAALSYKPGAYHVEGQSAPQPPYKLPPFPAQPVVGRTLRFTGEQAAEIKRQATDPSGSGWISTYDALTTHIFRQTYFARVRLLQSQGVVDSELDAHVFPSFLSSMSVRGPDRLDLPPRYFPNGVWAPYVVFTHKQVMEAPLWELTRTIHDWMRNLDVPALKQTVKWLAAQPVKTDIRPHNHYGNGSYLSSQWARFRAYSGTAFDGAHPILAGPPFTPVLLTDGPIYFLPTEEQLNPPPAGPAIDVNIALSERVWDFVENLVPSA